MFQPNRRQSSESVDMVNVDEEEDTIEAMEQPLDLSLKARSEPPPPPRPRPISPLTTKIEKVEEEPITWTIPFNTLPDHILQYFFGVFPLQEQLKLCGVCSKWNEIITKYYLHEKQSLKLFTCQEDLVVYVQGLIKSNQEDDEHYRIVRAGKASDDLVLAEDKWTAEVFERLKQILPNTRNIVIFLRSHKKPGSQLYHLLRLYGPRLVSLSFCGKLDIIPDAARRSLFHYLNALPVLRRLDLRSAEMTLTTPKYEYEPGNYRGFFIQPRLMRQLEHFSLCPAFLYYLPDVTTPLSPRCLRTLRIDHLPLTEVSHFALEMAFVHLNEPLANSITSLTITALGNEGGEFAVNILTFIGNHFPNLIELQYDLPRDLAAPLTRELLQPLTRLTQLKKLHLGFISFARRTTFEAKDAGDAASNNNRPPQLPVLNTVEHFSMILVTTNRGSGRLFKLSELDKDKLVANLSTIFPSLKVLILKPFGSIAEKSQLISEEEEKQFVNLTRYEAYSAKSGIPGRFLGRHA